MDWTIFAVAIYGVGYVVTAALLARYWFHRFGVELEGAIWGMLGAAFWPLVAPAWAIKEVASYGLN